MRETLLQLQAELAGLSTNSVHRVMAEAGHYVHRDRPDAVVAGIWQDVTAVQQSGSILPTEGSDDEM